MNQFATILLSFVFASFLRKKGRNKARQVHHKEIQLNNPHVLLFSKIYSSHQTYEFHPERLETLPSNVNTGANFQFAEANTNPGIKKGIKGGKRGGKKK